MCIKKSTFAIMFPGGRLFWKCMAFIVLYTSVVVWFDDHYFPKQKFDEVAGVLVTSVVLGVLLAFRTNSAYDRWWEGRKLWGQLVNDSRNLAIKAVTYIPDRLEHESFGKLLIAFPFALRDHLRDRGISDKLLELAPYAGSHPHPPGYLAKQIYNQIMSWKKSNMIDGFEFTSLDEHARALMDICGACERIKRSPISGSYKNLLWLSLGIYGLLLPWMLTPAIDTWTVPVVCLTAYFVLGLELLAEEVEEPFGCQANDLPLNSICNVIETSVGKIVEDPQLALKLSEDVLVPAAADQVK